MRLKWKIKMSAIVIIALAIIFLAYSRADVFKMASAEEKVVEVVEKKEEPELKGWGNKFFEALDQEVEDTKSFQKKQWGKMKKQFKDLLNIFDRDDKDWEELDKEIKEKEDATKEEK